MQSLSVFKKIFIFLTAICLLPLLLYLGFWQLERSELKRKILEQEDFISKQAPSLFQKGAATPSQYQPILVKGKYLPEILLLDNQHQDHQFGYNVLSPLELEDGQLLFIDRGFVPAANRQVLPKIENPKGEQSLKGYVYYPPKNSWVLGQQFETKSNKMTIVEQVNLPLFREILQKNAYPFIMRLHPSEKDGFLRVWTLVSLSPQRHLGYAVQWFGLAFVLAVSLLVVGFRKKK